MLAVFLKLDHCILWEFSKRWQEENLAQTFKNKGASLKEREECIFMDINEYLQRIPCIKCQICIPTLNELNSEVIRHPNFGEELIVDPSTHSKVNCDKQLIFFF